MYDYEMDVTDLWNDLTDPTNDRGDTATAYFDIWTHTPDEYGDFTIDQYRLKAIHVESGHEYGLITKYDRDGCEKLFGHLMVSDLEDTATEDNIYA